MAVFEIGAANLLGIAVYLASATVAIFTALRAAKAVSGGRMFWVAVSLIFVGLAVFRLLGAEEVIRQALRGLLIERMEYNGRRELQAAAVLTCLVASGIGLFMALPRAVHWPLWLAIASGSLVFMALLYSLRIISLHGVDRVLYASIGPLHVNHLLELLPIAAIWYAAWDFGQFGFARHRRSQSASVRPRI